MTIEELVKNLREEAEAVSAIEWEIPICTANHILEAAEVIEQLQRERDAAITDVELIVGERLSICEICKNENDYPMKGKCSECFPGAENNFEWRGISKEEDDGQSIL